MPPQQVSLLFAEGILGKDWTNPSWSSFMGIRSVAYPPHFTRDIFNNQSNTSDRKFRLLMIECYRRIADLCNEPDLHAVLEFFSEHVDRLRSSAELFDFFDQATDKHKSIFRTLARADGRVVAREALCRTAGWVVDSLTNQRYPDLKYGHLDYWVKCREMERQEEDLRLSWMVDIFGDSEEVGERTFSQRWQTTDVCGVAQAIYEERAFDRLPILADTLLDAGCNDEAILAHCCSEGPHVRGCWVVDLALGRD
jgi:hypothetical protein